MVIFEVKLENSFILRQMHTDCFLKVGLQVCKINLNFEF